MPHAASEKILQLDFAMQSARLAPEGLHVGIIMDGNGRWAARRGMPRQAGHRAGARSVRKVVTAARRTGLGVLTLYAFSSDNWARPEGEVSALMALFRRTLADEAERCVAEGIRLEVIGRRDRVSRPLLAAIERAERRTAGASRMLLRLAVDYSSRAALAAALDGARTGPADVAERLRRALHAATTVDSVDLVVRTGGEQRLSDFLLWEAAYAELFFTPTMWPDFGADDLDAALDWFRGRTRRFGRADARPVPRGATR
jgi:undecaprenyl diphosphate synthase